MSRRLFLTVCCVTTLAVGVSGCGNTRRVLGLEKKSPDEFTVVSRAPLTVPPDFKLRPPEPGADRPQEGSTADQARGALTGVQVATGGAVMRGGEATSGEASLLSQAGADKAPEDIRATVNRESSVLAEEEQSFTEKLVFWRDAPPPGTVVDPQGEAKRLRENQALGKSASEGDTPKIERREKGMLEGIF